MTRKTNGLAIALLAALLLVSIYAMFPVKGAKGPRSAAADIRFYANHEAAYTALIAGDVDFIQWSLTHEQRLAVEADPNMAIAGYDENGMFEFDLNNNYTVPMTYPGVRNPLHVKEFRQALTCMVDKQWIIDEILIGAGGLLNVPIAAPQSGWANESAGYDPLGPQFPWRYNETKAAELLANAPGGGFVDTDANGIRNYPADWPGRPGRPDMDPLKLYVRIEDKRLDAGRYLADQLTSFNIPFDKIEASSDVIFPIVMGDRNYHIYTGGWSLGRYPTYLYGLFHSSYYFPDGSNYVTGNDENNLPNYPELDPLVKEVYFATSQPEAEAAAKAATGLGWVELAINIPLWSYKSFIGWRKTMPAVINMEGYGYDNNYQFINAYNTLSPIRMGTINFPKAMNPLYSTWYYDYATMDRVFTSLIGVNPYNLATDQPGAVQDWEVGTWNDPHPGPGEPPTKYKLTYYLRKDVGIVAPVTGAFVRNLTVHDIEKSVWYTYGFDDAWNWPSYQDVHHTRIVNDYEIEFYFEDIGWLFYTSPQYPILTQEVIDILTTTKTVTFTVGDLGTDAQLELPTTDQIVQVVSEDLPGVEGVDFIIFGGYETYKHNSIWFPDGVAAGTYTIEYDTADLPSKDPHGFFLAGLPWQDTWYSFGPYYPIAIDEKNFASLNRNTHFWGETPILGEADWRWIWGDPDTGIPSPIPGPQNPGRDRGWFEIEIFDVVKATFAYDHSGTAEFDSKYFPGADLEGTDLGHIFIHDVTTITNKYSQRFGAPPP